MKPVITIQAEDATNATVISDIVRRAYAGVPYSDHREHLMIERLRGIEAFVGELSLVAKVDGEPAGHILLTRAQIRDGERAVDALALAPVSVAPECQRQGVGSRLIEAAHRQARSLGYGSILLVGIPDYHQRFGYQPLSRYPITLPFEAPEANCMILPLAPGALDGVAGMVEYPPGWLDH